MNRRRSHFSVLGSRFVFRFVVGAAVICSVAALRVDAVGRVLSDPPVQTTRPTWRKPLRALMRAAGQAMYAKAGCETCHGPNGQGTAAGPRIAGTARQLPAFVAYVTKTDGHDAAAECADGFGPGRWPTFSRSCDRRPRARSRQEPVQSDPLRPAGRAEARRRAVRKDRLLPVPLESGAGRTGGTAPRTRPDPVCPLLTIRTEPHG